MLRITGFPSLLHHFHYAHLFASVVVSRDGNALERLVPAPGTKLFGHDGGDVEAGVTPQVPRPRLPDEEAVEREDVEAELLENILWRGNSQSS